MLMILGGDIEALVSTIIIVMKQNEGSLPAFLRSEYKDGLSKSTASTITAFYLELSDKYPSALRYF
jgi:hypothetical protein